MSRKNNLTEIWNVYQDSIIKEATATRPIKGGNKQMGKKPGKGAVDLNSKDAQEIQNTSNSGTTAPVYDIDGLKEPVDPKNMKKKDKKDNLYSPEKYSSQQFDEKLGKRYRADINNSMKSIFDKLFEEVMDGSAEELDALGIESDVEETDGAEETVTLTLDRDMAKQLCDLLKEACGEDDDDDAEAEDGEYGEMEEMEEHEDEDEIEEAVDAEDHGHPLVNQKGGHPTPVTAGSNKVKSTVTGKAVSKKASGKIKKQDDSEGSDVGSKEAELTSVKAGSNKVKATSSNTPGASLFA
jgi:hypothetical protein